MTILGQSARILLSTIICLAFAGTVSAAQGVADGTGEARIKNGDKVTAKKAATGDALRRCIEKIVGLQIESNFNSEMKETVKNNKNTFDAQVSERLSQKASGFIQKYDVLKEWVEGDIMKITVRAHVFENKLDAEMKKLSDLISKASHPKVMLVIQDVYVTPEGKRSVNADSLVSGYLEAKLLARGVTIKGKRAGRAIAEDNPGKFTRWMENIDAIAKTAREEGADLLLFGQVEMTNNGKYTKETAGGFSALIGQLDVEISSMIRGINASSGEQFSSATFQMKSMGTNMERATKRAFTGSKGKNANLLEKTFKRIFKDLQTSIITMGQGKQSYVVSLTGVTSFRKQGRKFLSLLEKISSVSKVKQKSFDAGKLVVDLACECNPQQLQDKIFDASEKVSSFENIDIAGVSGSRLTFKL